MNKLTLIVILVLLTTVSGAAKSSESPGFTGLNAFDVVQRLLQSSGPLDSEDIAEIFGLAVESNIRVPPEHIGVAFHDSRTGEAVAPEEIRALLGPVRQDGAAEIWDWVGDMFGAHLNMNTEQLRLLMDAAFLASMRNPPQHISVEFYDRRQGPSGTGGGVSGSVPEGRPAPEPEPRLDSRGPGDLDELADAIREQGMTAGPREGHLLLPLFWVGRDEPELEAEFRELLVDLSDLGLYLSTMEIVESALVPLDDGFAMVLALAYIRGDQAVMERLSEGLPSFDP